MKMNIIKGCGKKREKVFFNFPIPGNMNYGTFARLHQMIGAKNAGKEENAAIEMLLEEKYTKEKVGNSLRNPADLE